MYVFSFSYTCWILRCNCLDHYYLSTDHQNFIICKFNQNVLAYEISLQSDNSFLISQYLCLKVYYCINIIMHLLKEINNYKII